MDKFYVIRGENCYRTTFEQKTYGRIESQDEAISAALKLASAIQSTQCVYEVKLVGRAELPKAYWTRCENEY